jgi:alanyl-tRNA synthetase
MTEKTYYAWDAFGPGAADAFSARVVELRPYAARGEDCRAAALDRTIFYPEGGGQPGDRGTLNGHAVLDTREEDGVVLHLLEAGAAAGLRVGAEAALRLDVERRQDLSAHHTAQHLLSGCILRLGGAWTVSMHMGAEYCTIDVDAPALDEGTLRAAEEAVFEAIQRDVPVITHLCPPEDVHSFPLRKKIPQTDEQIRVVEIQGFDFSPCCGTHLKSAGQIGMLQILGAERYKGMTRVSFVAGRRSLAYSRLLRDNCGGISRRLSVPAGETRAAVEALQEKCAALEERLRGQEEAIAGFKADLLLAGAGGGEAPIRHLFAEEGIDDLMRIGKLAQKRTGRALILGSKKENAFVAFCSAPGADLKALLAPALEARGGKGGGKGGFFRGAFPPGAAGLEGLLGA